MSPVLAVVVLSIRSVVESRLNNLIRPNFLTTL